MDNYFDASFSDLNREIFECSTSDFLINKITELKYYGITKLNVRGINQYLRQQNCHFRPFLVKEEKLLLLATETGEQEDIVRAISEIITECTDISDVSKLSTFDIEYVFLQIHKSVGESVDVSITCPDDNETEVKISIPWMKSK